MVLQVENIFAGNATNAQDEFFANLAGRGSTTYLVGTDYTAGGVSNTTTETELLTYDIPANTISNGIIVTFIAATSVDTIIGNKISLRVKCGTDGSEDTYATIVFNADTFGSPDYSAAEFIAGNTTNVADSNLKQYMFIIDDKDWTVAQTVSITTQAEFTNTETGGAAHMLTILGY